MNPRLPDYLYKIAVVRVIDGDTVVADTALGFHATMRLNLRLLGVNCPELKTPAGPAAKAFTEAWALANAPLTARTVKADKYGGRWDATVYGADGGSLNAALLAAGHAVPFMVPTAAGEARA